MYKICPKLLENRCIKDQSLHNAPSSNKPLLGWIRAYLLVLLVCEVPELSLCASVAGSKVKHEGFCPNKLNSNLWVDAQSTCERECNVDEVEFFTLSYVHFVFFLVYVVIMSDLCVLCLCRTALTLRNAAPTCVASTAVWLHVSLMAPLPSQMDRVEEKKVMPPPPSLPVRDLSAASRGRSVTSGMDSPSASARTGVRKSLTSPVPQMASPTSTAATWTEKPASVG